MLVRMRVSVSSWTAQENPYKSATTATAAVVAVARVGPLR